MPPDVIQFRPTLAPLQFSSQLTLKQRSSPRDHRQGMNLTNKKKLMPILLLILSIISILRLLSLILRTSSSATMSPPPSSSLFSTHNKVAKHAPDSSKHPNSTLTEKEFKVLSNLVALKSPSNLLIFGFQPQYLTLSSMNAPAEVYEKKWDIIVVDGPKGDSPESPGRMGSIYTASVLARAGNVSDVVVHDVDRMIEKWFSLEFLCHENLLCSKGKLWHFRISGHSNSTTFCTSMDKFVPFPIFHGKEKHAARQCLSEYR